jgi:hypothetical protein
MTAINDGKGIPFVDLVTPHMELEEELIGVVRGVLSTGMLAGGRWWNNSSRTLQPTAEPNTALASATELMLFDLR